MKTARKLLTAGALGVALSIAAALQSSAQNDNALASAKTEITDPAYSVGVMDLRGETLENAIYNASKYSKTGIILFYMGNNEDLINKARRGASEAKDGGADVYGMVLAKPHPDAKGGEDTYYVVVGGRPVTKLIAAKEWPVKMAKAQIEDAYEDYGHLLKPVAEKLEVNRP